MKKLIILRGPSLCGKTSLVKELGLENNVISPDDVRRMFYGYEIYEDTTRILKKDNFKIFKEVYTIVEQRMEYGLLTVIDHTNLIEQNIEKYRNLCFKYGYEAIVVNFKSSLNELLEKNKGLEHPYEEEKIRDEYKEFTSQKIPNFCKVIAPQQLKSEISFRYPDMSKYKKVVHIGDIHGCATVLKEALGNMDFNTLYVFCGDYIDRGLENIDVLKFLIEIKRKPNVILLKGNHELNLVRYVNGEETYSKSFERTQQEIENSDLEARDLRDLCKCMKNYFAYNYKGKKIIATHGGISSLKDLALVSEYSFIMGSGDMDKTNVDEEFQNNTRDVVQVHGHRNPFDIEISKYNRSFNLEGAVEDGGCLRTLEINEKGNFTGRTYENKIFSSRPVKSYED